MIQVLAVKYIKAVYDDPPTIMFKGYRLFSNIYSIEDINDNHSVLKLVPIIKTNKCLYIRM